MHTKSYRAFREIACVASVSVCFRAKKDRGTRFSVLAARKMERERKRAFLSLLFSFRAGFDSRVPRFLLRNRTETLAI